MKTILSIVAICTILVSCHKNDKEITTGEWEVVSVTPSASTMAIDAPDSYILNLDKRTFELKLNANTVNGSLKVNKKGRIEFDKELISTAVCCDSEYAENMRDQLVGMTHYAVTNDQLIFTGNGRITLERK